MATFKIFKILPYALLLAVLISCASKQSIVEEEVGIVQKPKILFVNYSIKKLPNGEKNIALINQITAEGKLKKSSKEEENAKPEDLEYTVIDSDSNLLDKAYIENPLVKIVEFVNDLGNFEKRILELDSAQFTIRLQLDSKAKYITISELTQTETKKHITTKIE